jgi:Flp pilus assembly protein TadG
MQRLLNRFFQREDGTATIEFVIVFPLVMIVFMSVFEAAVLTTRYTMMERALDLTVRGLRLTTGTAPTHAQVRDKICEYTNMIENCSTSLIVELTPIQKPTFNLPATDAPCVDRAATSPPLVTLTHGVANQLMLIRACAVVDPMFPLTGLGLSLTKDASGGVQMIAVSAYVGEP